MIEKKDTYSINHVNTFVGIKNKSKSFHYSKSKCWIRNQYLASSLCSESLTKYLLCIHHTKHPHNFIMITNQKTE